MFKKDDIVVSENLEVKVYNMIGECYFSGVVIKGDDEYDIGYESDGWNTIYFKLKYRPTNSNDLLLEIKQELEVIKEKLNKAINKPEMWRADMGEEYYYINAYFEVGCYNESYMSTDELLYSTGNYFQTREEAQKYADRMKQLLLNREI